MLASSEADHAVPRRDSGVLPLRATTVSSRTPAYRRYVLDHFGDWCDHDQDVVRRTSDDVLKYIE
jgi:hypothetical protein